MSEAYYSIENLDKEGATINIAFGERANGKSYQVKHEEGIKPYLFGGYEYVSDYKNPKEVIKKAIKKGQRFMLVRRLVEEIKPTLIESYFADIDIMTLTDNKYNLITVYANGIYLSIYDVDTGKTKRIEKIGYVVALSIEQNYAGGSYLDVRVIIMEEFMSRKNYLYDESNKLLNLYSTCDRKRGIVKMYLVGNTISRVCPYLKDWGLDKLMRGMKQGEIRSTWITTNQFDEDGIEIKVKLALEYCKSTGKSSFIIGTHAKMLNEGQWQSDPQPKLPKSYKEYKVLFRMVFDYKGFKYLVEYITEKDGIDSCWFVRPKYNEIKKKTLVFSDNIKTSKYYQKDVYNPLINNDNIKRLLQTFRESNIFFANDLCGTEFKQSIDFIIRK
jgi:hypothetical protein